MSIPELTKTIPVTSPTVKRKYHTLLGSRSIALNIYNVVQHKFSFKQGALILHLLVAEYFIVVQV